MITYFPSSWSNYHSDGYGSPDRGVVINDRNRNTGVEQFIDEDAKTITIRPDSNDSRVKQFGWPNLASHLEREPLHWYPGYRIIVLKAAMATGTTPASTTNTVNIAGAPPYINTLGTQLLQGLSSLGVDVTNAGQAASSAAGDAKAAKDAAVKTADVTTSKASGGSDNSTLLIVVAVLGFFFLHK